MFYRLRIRLARWILPSDTHALVSFGCGCLYSVMAHHQCNMLRKELGRGQAMEVYYLDGPERNEGVKLRCEVCTCEFTADADGPARCPSCDSRDCELV